MTRAALYLRVSTDGQTVENQRAELAQLANARGWAPGPGGWYEETASAAKTRPVLDRLMADARAGRVQVVAVWALDRLDRSMVGAVQRVLELDRLGVQVVSVREGWLDTSGPVRSLLVAIFGWVAEQERARLIERTRAGLARAREKGTRSGKPIGRPRASPVLLSAAAEKVRNGQVEAGLGRNVIRAAARDAGVSESSLRRWMRQNPPSAIMATPPERTRVSARRS